MFRSPGSPSPADHLAGTTIGDRHVRQNTVPSLTTGSAERRPAASRARAGGPPPRCRLRARAPAESSPCHAERSADRAARCGRAARRSARAIRPPAANRPGSAARAAAGSSRRDHAGVDEQAAVAVFGEPGQAVDVGDRDAGLLQRLDQRIGEPLRQLVERHEAVGRVVAPDRRMPPGVAERDAAEREPARPDRSEMRRSSASRIRGAGNRPSSACAGEMVEQAARARAIVARRRPPGSRRPPRRASRAAPRGLRGRPADWRRSTWKPAARSRGRQRRQPLGIGAQRVARIGREGAGLEHAQACDARGLRSARRSCRLRRRDSASPARRRHRAAPRRWRDRKPRAPLRRRRPAASPRRGRPRDRARRRRNAASAHGTARRGSDNSRGSRSATRSAAAGSRARSTVKCPSLPLEAGGQHLAARARARRRR